MNTLPETLKQPARWTAHATVATVVEKEGKFLLVEERRLINSQGDFGIVYNQPAGHVDEGETIMAAAIRETLEETRWEVKLKHFIGIYVFVAASNGLTYHRYCFAADAIKHHPECSLDDGILDAKWLSWEEIQQLDNLRTPLVINCIKDYLEGKQFPLDIIYEHTDHEQKEHEQKNHDNASQELEGRND